MNPDELNPHHPVTKAFSDQWHKIAALIMVHFDRKNVAITMEDLAKLPGNNITIEAIGEIIWVRLVDDKEANRLAKGQGGVFPN